MKTNLERYWKERRFSKKRIKRSARETKWEGKGMMKGFPYEGVGSISSGARANGQIWFFANVIIPSWSARKRNKKLRRSTINTE